MAFELSYRASQYVSSIVLSEVWARRTEECGIGGFVYSVRLYTLSSRLGREASLLSEFPDVSKGM